MCFEGRGTASKVLETERRTTLSVKKSKNENENEVFVIFLRLSKRAIRFFSLSLSLHARPLPSFSFSSPLPNGARPRGRRPGASRSGGPCRRERSSRGPEEEAQELAFSAAAVCRRARSRRRCGHQRAPQARPPASRHARGPTPGVAGGVFALERRGAQGERGNLREKNRDERFEFQNAAARSRFACRARGGKKNSSSSSSSFLLPGLPLCLPRLRRRPRHARRLRRSLPFRRRGCVVESRLAVPALSWPFDLA